MYKIITLILSISLVQSAQQTTVDYNEKIFFWLGFDYDLGDKQYSIDPYDEFYQGRIRTNEQNDDTYLANDGTSYTCAKYEIPYYYYSLESGLTIAFNIQFSNIGKNFGNSYFLAYKMNDKANGYFIRVRSEKQLEFAVMAYDTSKGDVVMHQLFFNLEESQTFNEEGWVKVAFTTDLKSFMQVFADKKIMARKMFDNDIKYEENQENLLIGYGYDQKTCYLNANLDEFIILSVPIWDLSQYELFVQREKKSIDDYIIAKYIGFDWGDFGIKTEEFGYAGSVGFFDRQDELKYSYEDEYYLGDKNFYIGFWVYIDNMSHTDGANILGFISPGLGDFSFSIQVSKDHYLQLYIGGEKPQVIELVKIIDYTMQHIVVYMANSYDLIEVIQNGRKVFSREIPEQYFFDNVGNTLQIGGNGFTGFLDEIEFVSKFMDLNSEINYMLNYYFEYNTEAKRYLHSYELEFGVKFFLSFDKEFEDRVNVLQPQEFEASKDLQYVNGIVNNALRIPAIALQYPFSYIPELDFSKIGVSFWLKAEKFQPGRIIGTGKDIFTPGLHIFVEKEGQDYLTLCLVDQAGNQNMIDFEQQKNEWEFYSFTKQDQIDPQYFQIYLYQNGKRGNVLELEQEIISNEDPLDWDSLYIGEQGVELFVIDDFKLYSEIYNEQQWENIYEKIVPPYQPPSEPTNPPPEQDSDEEPYQPIEEEEIKEEEKQEEEEGIKEEEKEEEIKEEEKEEQTLGEEEEILGEEEEEEEQQNNSGNNGNVGTDGGGKNGTSNTGSGGVGGGIDTDLGGKGNTGNPSPGDDNNPPSGDGDDDSGNDDDDDSNNTGGNNNGQCPSNINNPDGNNSLVDGGDGNQNHTTQIGDSSPNTKIEENNRENTGLLVIISVLSVTLFITLITLGKVYWEKKSQATKYQALLYQQGVLGGGPGGNNALFSSENQLPSPERMHNKQQTIEIQSNADITNIQKLNKGYSMNCNQIPMMEGLQGENQQGTVVGQPMPFPQFMNDGNQKEFKKQSSIKLNEIILDQNNNTTQE